jgi:hypothetical protein
MRSLAVALGTLLVAAPLAAQGNCFPGDHSHEADLFAHFSVPIAFSPAQSPWIYPPGTVLVGIEGTYVPDASDRIATPTTCRPGKGPENVNLLTGFPRPRLAYALTDGVLLEASWTPPVRLNGVKPNLWSFALSRSVPLGTGGTMFMGRAHATFGSLHAPITCPDAALKDPTSQCFGGQRSDDRYSPNIFGIELALGWVMGQGRLRPYIGGGYNMLRPRFQVDFTDAGGVLDDSKVEVNLHRWTLFGGATWAPVPGFGLTAEAYSAPADLITARLRATLALGGQRRR